MHEDAAAGIMLVTLGAFVLLAATFGQATTGGAGVAGLTAVWLGARLLVRAYRVRRSLPAARCIDRRAVEVDIASDGNREAANALRAVS